MVGISRGNRIGLYGVRVRRLFFVGKRIWVASSEEGLNLS
jgi:hypothetical protein